jgi:hypothetical protein
MQRRRHVTASGIFSNNEHPLICMSRNLVKGARRVVDLQGAQRGTIYARGQSTRTRTSYDKCGGICTESGGKYSRSNMRLLRLEPNSLAAAAAHCAAVGRQTEQAIAACPYTTRRQNHCCTTQTPIPRTREPRRCYVCLQLCLSRSSRSSALPAPPSHVFQRARAYRRKRSYKPKVSIEVPKIKLVRRNNLSEGRMSRCGDSQVSARRACPSRRHYLSVMLPYMYFRKRYLIFIHGI